MPYKLVRTRHRKASSKCERKVFIFTVVMIVIWFVGVFIAKHNGLILRDIGFGTLMNLSQLKITKTPVNVEESGHFTVEHSEKVADQSKKNVQYSYKSGQLANGLVDLPKQSVRHSTKGGILSNLAVTPRVGDNNVLHHSVADLKENKWKTDDANRTRVEQAKNETDDYVEVEYRTGDDRAMDRASLKNASHVINQEFTDFSAENEKERNRKKLLVKVNEASLELRSNGLNITIRDEAREDNKKWVVERKMFSMRHPNLILTTASFIVPEGYKFERDKEIELEIDFRAVPHKYSRAMLGFAFATGALRLEAKSTGKVLFGGLGGGIMNSFLHHSFPQVKSSVFSLISFFC
ncbi:hypothetical protein AB6A40_007925 [Gnathostoma spinigerum]|uniref:Uncharacterized protein n=1 Tax=Gnathostoma spinigerum TaxID=75299 RepID=A0ABD6EN58_9BILA